MYTLSIESLNQVKETVKAYCKSDAIPVREGQRAINEFFTRKSGDIFLIWDALGCDELGYRAQNPEIHNLYKYLGELVSAQMDEISYKNVI